jgi:hypothetical protein
MEFNMELAILIIALLVIGSLIPERHQIRHIR